MIADKAKNNLYIWASEKHWLFGRLFLLGKLQFRENKKAASQF